MSFTRFAGQSMSRVGQWPAFGRVVQRHPVGAFFILAWGLSWLIWTPLVISALTNSPTRLPSTYHYVGSIGPLLAALIVSAVEGGRSSVRALLVGFVPRRETVAWLLLALLGPIAIFVTAAAILHATGAAWPDLRQLGRSEEFPGLGPISLWLVFILTFGVGEETGWRGCALPRLQRAHGAFTATLLLTLGWALWHAPAFLYRPGYQSMGIAGVAGFVFSLFVGAIILTWLFNTTGGSLLAVIFFHGSIELVYVSRASDARLFPIMGVLLTIWAACVVWWTGPGRLGRRQRVMHPTRSVPNAPARQARRS